MSSSINRRDAIQLAFDAVLGIVDEVLTVTLADVERAKAIVLGKRRLSSRDALHVAIMERERIERVMSFDRGFDAVPGVIASYPQGSSLRIVAAVEAKDRLHRVANAHHTTLARVAMRLQDAALVFSGRSEPSRA